MSASTNKQAFKWVSGGAIVVGLLALMTSCSTPSAPTSESASSSQTTQADQAESTTILIDGSSTVYPLTNEAVQEFLFERTEDPEFNLAFSGTTGGFTKFCAGETDISNASRPINTTEMEACKAAGVEYIELPVAYDALTVVVHPDNTWVESLTVAELKKVWEPAAEGIITTWNQIRSEFPNRPINLYGAGEASGTFDYFTEAIVGESRASRKDYTASENDEDLVRGIRNDPNGLAYFGYAYYDENQRLLKPVAIDNGNGPVVPSSETVISGDYQPLSRPLFIYVNTNSLNEKTSLREFVEFYLLNAEMFAKAVGYVPLSDEIYTIAIDHLQQNKVGTVFAGETQTNLKLDELLQKEKAF